MTATSKPSSKANCAASGSSNEPATVRTTGLAIPDSLNPRTAPATSASQISGCQAAVITIALRCGICGIFTSGACPAIRALLTRGLTYLAWFLDTSGYVC